MDYYYFVEAVVGIIAGLLLVICTKKAEGVTYSKLDRAGRIVNIVLLVVYALISPFCMFIGALLRPAHEGFLGFIGGLVSVIGASAVFFCSLGLGASVALRKKGKSKLSFAIQFAGFAGIILMMLIFILFYGNLLDTLN